MQITARVDYAVRALVELATRGGDSVTGPQIAEAQDIPAKFLESIMRDLKRDGLVVSQRGRFGGYAFGVPADRISIADVVRAVDGPLAAVRGLPREDVAYQGAATALTTVWVAVRAAMRAVLEQTTIADVAAGEIPPAVTAMLTDDAWKRRR
ncbi:RrF2 family transcriptional regulator [Rarobacter incanus]|uniref:BadM/Rrf2 family transcriptional regulator n=1 Tax=Rarobacter incanus TaxID=153494 RepID=A0A542SN88_9MICO|nr:Rrf2 family transcriptional regulator [Rarobacter incanus]TQK76091.1 BadM/Rrf2 family transcriptional regulator [Rarobacter incanus]